LFDFKRPSETQRHLPYTSASTTSGASSFSKIWKQRPGIWFAGNLRVEVVAEQGASIHRESERTYSRKVGLRQIPFSETGLPALGIPVSSAGMKRTELLALPGLRPPIWYSQNSVEGGLQSMKRRPRLYGGGFLIGRTQEQERWALVYGPRNGQVVQRG
jgi:hypothetical protein